MRFFVLSVLLELLLHAAASGSPPPFTVEDKTTPRFTVTNKIPPPAPVTVPPGALRTDSGEWIAPDPARPGYYVPLPRSGVVPGVTTHRPFPAGGSTARTTPATPAPFAGTSPPPTNGGTPPRTTAPTASKAATPTAPTITSARGAVPAASSLAGSIEIGSGKTIASDWYDDQGNHFIRYTDGSTKICSAYG